jgi:hypothetical protein
MARLLSLVIVTVLLLASGPVGAQQPVAPPPPQIPYGAPISLEQAKKVLAGAEAEAQKNKWNMVIAVLDSGGHLVMLARMDGTQLGSIDAAKDKAYSAVLYRRPTKVFQDLVGQGGANLRLLRLSGAPARSRAGSRSRWTERLSARSACPAPLPSRMRRSPRPAPTP